MKTKFISDLQFGDKLTGELFAIKSIRKGKTADGRDYIDLVLSDRSGEIQGKVWDNKIENCESIEVGSIVNLSGSVEEFREKQQLRVTFLQKETKFDIGDFLPKSKKDLNELWQIIATKINGLQDKNLKKLASEFYNAEKQELIMNAPAGEILHHNYLGGYLEHITEMLNFAEAVKNDFNDFDNDLLVCGVLLHDIGKLRELAVDRTIYRTLPGSLIGHLTLGVIDVSAAMDKIKNFPEDLRNKVTHIVVSHHGRLEYGSPMRPMTREAIAIYYMDNLSAKLNTAQKVYSENQNSEADFSDYNYALESKIYLN